MANWQKTLEAVLSGSSDANIPFGDLTVMLQRLGYTMRQKGSHCIFTKPNAPIINIQNTGGKAKSYQVAQIRAILAPPK